MKRSSAGSSIKIGGGEQLDSSTTPHPSYSTSFFSSKHLLAAMADFFTSSSVATVTAKRVQEAKTVPPPPADKAEYTIVTNSAGSNFSMCEIIM
ncbi:unnamed protein product [Rhizoctonia solani]|uniref:Uncharacterized protein n=1 Tax=Rhizoctonia solani TaxID=456999 RepID=A0A8H3HK70_9AGAM|nr:unnamed protein product [Rhizoctonia solani]CAE6523639.1 unnamed protein product [Rhizoctonia solani]